MAVAFLRTSCKFDLYFGIYLHSEVKEELWSRRLCHLFSDKPKVSSNLTCGADVIEK